MTIKLLPMPEWAKMDNLDQEPNSTHRGARHD
jgi:hypothetical protein